MWRIRLDAGAGLCDEDVVRMIVEAGPDCIADLVSYGVDFDKEADGDFSLGKEGGHTHRRILHAKDTTGKEIADSLLAVARASENVDLLEDHFVVDLITTAKLGMATGENRCIGLYALEQASGEIKTFRSDRVVLCTGGSGRVYLYTTNPSGATGDGVAMAWRAGATISDMEFSQFHPTCLYHHEKKSFLISEAVRGEGGVLIGQDGEEFMQNYDRRKSLAPRDIVARAIDREIKRTGGPCVFVDITHKPDGFMAERFPHIYKTCMEVGIDPSKDPIPVVPAAHYQCGGVQTDMNGRTSINGLYAIGEVACTGLHGANRLASNSLLEGAVLADRAYGDLQKNDPVEGVAIQPFEIPAWVSGDAEDVDELVVIYHNWDEIRRLMWDYVGIVRTDKRLKRAGTRLRNLKREVLEFYWNFKIGSDLLELRNLVDTAALIVDSASTRRESRGLHYTLDHLELDESHPPRHSILKRG